MLRKRSGGFLGQSRGGRFVCPWGSHACLSSKSVGGKTFALTSILNNPLKSNCADVLLIATKAGAISRSR